MQKQQKKPAKTHREIPVSIRLSRVISGGGYGVCVWVQTREYTNSMDTIAQLYWAVNMFNPRYENQQLLYKKQYLDVALRVFRTSARQFETPTKGLSLLSVPWKMFGTSFV